ncbi:hypothetical protein C1I98_22165 [Spongiactinospora gelatinilytica]|uniref:Uncharacterized protein n=2 Tax=Spongiactinospora gelatinilytica TaxID=2666298 RepID=A0A2W2GLN2_9ACTN|nr:hypothetical protein C1I98_22165 [Spongiactinospora gelatinilytica]
MMPDDRRLEVIRQTYPGWRITVLKGVWFATRHRPPDTVERALGVHHQLARLTGDDLVAALAEQADILHRARRT